jgi:hypothetical protein
MTTNPEMDLRTEVEVRDVQQAVKLAMHCDLIDVQYRPAATPEDLLDGLNDVRPTSSTSPATPATPLCCSTTPAWTTPRAARCPLSYWPRALGATAEPPTLLVLNGCDSLDAAEVLLEVTPMVIAMATENSDLAASAFAARFYAAVAAAWRRSPGHRVVTWPSRRAS